MNKNGYTALDPNEGPTAWLKRDSLESAEEALYTIVEGKDPNNPLNKVRLNENEMSRALNQIHREKKRERESEAKPA